jgi:hypothetical protein
MAHDPVLFGTTNFKWPYSNTSGKNGPIIAKKVGRGFTSTDCEERAASKSWI